MSKQVSCKNCDYWKDGAWSDNKGCCHPVARAIWIYSGYSCGQNNFAGICKYYIPKPPEQSEFEKFAYSFIRKQQHFRGDDAQLKRTYDWILDNMQATWQACRERFLDKCLESFQQYKGIPFHMITPISDIAAELDAENQK